MSLVDDIGHVLAPPHPAGRPFILGGLIAVILGLAIASWLAWLGLLCHPVLPVLLPRPRAGGARPARRGGRARRWPCGFGDARRAAGGTRSGRHAALARIHLPVDPQRPREPVPADGIITRIAYRHGSFLNAGDDRASEVNERNAVALRLADGREIAVVQIAGLIARRIVCDLREGDQVRAGQRFGIIRFGSRADLYLPEGVRPLVAVGQTMIGGETVIAELTP